jgi:hypothetical protein
VAGLIFNDEDKRSQSYIEREARKSKKQEAGKELENSLGLKKTGNDHFTQDFVEKNQRCGYYTILKEFWNIFISISMISLMFEVEVKRVMKRRK